MIINREVVFWEEDTRKTRAYSVREDTCNFWSASVRIFARKGETLESQVSV